MRSLLRTWAAPLALALCLAASAAGQDDSKDLHPYKNSAGAAPAQAAPQDAGEKAERPMPALPATVALLSAVLVLSLICVPSRKAEAATSR